MLRNSIAASPQFGVPDQTDVFFVGNNGQLHVAWVSGGGAWDGPIGLGPADIFPRPMSSPSTTTASFVLPGSPAVALGTRAGSIPREGLRQAA